MDSTHGVLHLVPPLHESRYLAQPLDHRAGPEGGHGAVGPSSPGSINPDGLQAGVACSYDVERISTSWFVNDFWRHRTLLAPADKPHTVASRLLIADSLEALALFSTLAAALANGENPRLDVLEATPNSFEE